MLRHTTIRPAQCCALEQEEIRALRGFYGGSPSIKVTVTVYNLSSKSVTYYDNRYGVLDAVKLTGDHMNRSGVSVIVTLEVPTDMTDGPIGVLMNELISAAVEKGNVQQNGLGTVYEYGFSIGEYNLVDGAIHKDAVTGVHIGVGNCDWRAVSGDVMSNFTGRGNSFRGRLQAIEFVDDHRPAIYIAGAKEVEVIRATQPHVAGRKPGVYISTIAENGDLQVKSYSTCESCRADENLAIYERITEAEAFMENLNMPSGKKNSSTGAGASSNARSISDRLRERAGRHPGYTAQQQAQPSGGKSTPGGNSAQGASHTFDRRSRYERASDGRSWFVLVMELLDSLMGQIIRMTHKEGFGKWFSTGGT